MTFIAFLLANILAVRKERKIIIYFLLCLFEIKDFILKSPEVQLSRLKNRKRDPKLLSFAAIFGQKVQKINR